MPVVPLLEEASAVTSLTGHKELGQFLEAQLQAPHQTEVRRVLPPGAMGKIIVYAVGHHFDTTTRPPAFKSSLCLNSCVKLHELLKIPVPHL